VGRDGPDHAQEVQIEITWHANNDVAMCGNRKVPMAKISWMEDGDRMDG